MTDPTAVAIALLVCVTVVTIACLLYFFDWEKLRRGEGGAPRADTSRLEQDVAVLQEQNVRLHDKLDAHRGNTDERVYRVERDLAALTLEQERLKSTFDEAVSRVERVQTQAAQDRQSPGLVAGMRRP